VAITHADVWRSFDAAVSWQTAQPRVTSTWEVRGWQGGGYIGETGANAYNPAAPGNRLRVTSPTSLSMRLDCLYNGEAATNRCSGRARYSIEKLDLTMADNVAPQVSPAVSGPLLAGGWLTGSTATVSLSASDVGAGAYRAFVRVGSTTRYAVLDPLRGSCADAEPDAGTAYEFSELVPCATAATAYSPAFSLAGIGDGVHTNVTVGIEDAAGNERVALTGQTLRVNAPGGSLPDPGTACLNGTHDDAGVCQTTPPARTSDPVLSGTAQAGGTLTTDDGTWNGIAGATWSHGWQRCDASGSGCADIAGAVGRTYGPTTDDVGKRLRSRVTATTSAGSATAYSAPSPIVAAGGGGGGTGGGGTVTPVPPGGGGGGGGGAPTPPPSAPVPPPTPPAPGGSSRANGTNATSGATIALRANGSDRREVAVRYGRQVVVAGRLATPGGKAISGATIDVFTAPRTGASAARREAPVVSDADGAFNVTLPVGPSRLVRFAYRASLDDTEYAETAELDVRVRTAARLRATPPRLRNGAAVTFRGTVAGAPRGSRKVVEMQVRQNGRWLTFATTRLRGGRFAHRYRFTRTTATTRYAFRAVVRTEAGWPYETGASNPARVKVRP
ncbi:MAG TPA: hypothetical protein VIL49_03120, partial [Capillimicrobium sp.]|jgi:hypothetical protein